MSRLMSGLSFRARDTVEGDTPKARAMSLMVICGLFMAKGFVAKDRD